MYILNQNGKIDMQEKVYENMVSFQRMIKTLMYK